MNVTNLADNNRAQRVTDTRIGGNNSVCLPQPMGNLLIQLLNLVFQKHELLKELPYLKSKGILGKVQPFK